MPRLKFLSSLAVFILFMIFTSIIKNQTRIIEKNITKYQNKVINIESNLHEVQLDYYYLSSPENLSKKIRLFIDEEYIPMHYSKIYLSYEIFKKNTQKTTKSYSNEEKSSKK